MVSRLKQKKGIKSAPPIKYILYLSCFFIVGWRFPLLFNNGAMYRCSNFDDYHCGVKTYEFIISVKKLRFFFPKNSYRLLDNDKKLILVDFSFVYNI